MIGVIAKATSHIDRVRKATERGLVRILFRRSASLRRDAAESIEQQPGPSEEGSPIHTHRRMFARRALRFDVDKKRLDAVIGPRASMIGKSMAANEYGGEYLGSTYPARPTMGPALERNEDKYADDFRGSIGA